MFTFKFVISAASLLCLASLAAQAAPVPCSKRDELISALNGKYREQLSGYGLAGQSSMVEVYVSEKGSWTILMSNTNGVSCIIAAGQNWEAMTAGKNLTSL